MYIHVGGEIILRSKDIIAILNGDVQDISSITNHYLEAEGKRKQKIVISADYIKSIVITNDEIYYSPISTLTLNRRALGKSIIEHSVDKKEEIES